MSLELAIVLLLGGLAILVLELFIPSAGVLFVLASGCMIASVVVAFNVSLGAGLVFLVIVCVLAMVLPFVGVELWKRSPLGRMMLMESDVPPKTVPGEEEQDAGLVGEIGRVLTPLRPSGTVLLGRHRLDAITEGGKIERGEIIRVVGLRGTRVVVRRATSEESMQAFGQATVEDEAAPAQRAISPDFDFDELE